MIKELPNVTLVAICGDKHGDTVASLHKSLKQIKPARTLLLTNKDLSLSGIEVINVGGLDSWEAYNIFVIKEISKYIDTEYFIISQWDSWILDSEQWDDRYYEFDYIGAIWLDIGKPFNMGNGGGSWRSKKLHDILSKDDFIQICTPEDTAICKLYRTYLEDNYGIKFATEEVANKFSFELNEPIQKTLMFHGFHHEPYKETVVVKRSYAIGDVIMVEPVLHYFHKKGYRVALDTTPENMAIYSQHYFPVYPKSSLNPKLKYREIDLDMSYEKTPKQPVLQSYFEAAGITDEPLRNARLNLYSGAGERLFKKYVVIHIDDTAVIHRNIKGIYWSAIVDKLKEKGYSVFQIGRRIEKPIATVFNTINIDFLKFFIKGADLFIGIDSAPSHIAVAFNVPSIIFFGSVNPKFRHIDFSNIEVIQNYCPKEGCYHEVISEKGQDCYYNKEMPPCTNFNNSQVIKAINKLAQ